MSTICRACCAGDLKLVKSSNVASTLKAADFAITDDDYGVTGDIYRCSTCGFMQCSDMPDVLNFYKDLIDHGYEMGRDQRLLQARALMKNILTFSPRKERPLRLLDIGAGSGILVQAALEHGIAAEGIEPSEWLASTARQHGCRVHSGVLPHPGVTGPYDVITLIDVIEHVKDPTALLQAARSVLGADGVIAIATPDASSFAARIMGWRWWHYRIAHIGYFNPSNLTALCNRVGFEKTTQLRPSWYFTITYLRQRLQQYVPWWLLPKVDWMDRTIVPLNLYDSILLICRRAPAAPSGAFRAEQHG